MRRYGLPPARGRAYTRRPGAYAVLVRGGEVLLTFQRAPVPEFQLPGGGIEPGEQPIAALHREVREETGWAISTPVRVGVWRRFTYMPEYDLWAEKICHVFRARPTMRIGPPVEPEHCALFVPVHHAIVLLSLDAEAEMLIRAAPGA